MRVRFSGGVSSWLLSDPFSNTTASITTDGSTVSGARSLNAFGVARTAATGSLASSAIGFAGQYLDSATGLYDMRARDYDPTSGRFTANDPIAVPTGMPYVAGYSYAYNNPLTGTDATGRWTSDCGSISALCDMGVFLGSEALGAGKVALNVLIGVASWSIDPVGTAINTVNAATNSCNAGFAQYGGNGPSGYGFLQCLDNINPFAAIRNQFSASLNATNVQDSGEAFGQGLFSAGLMAAPFAKGFGPKCGGKSIVAELDSASTWGKGNLPLTNGPPNGVLVKRSPSGDITNYSKYNESGYVIKRVDLTGRSHAGIPTPHTVDYALDTNPAGQIFPRGLPVRPATLDEVP